MNTDIEPPPDLDDEPPLPDDPDRPYQDLGGGERPNAYTGAKEFDCDPPAPKDQSGKPIKGVPNGCGAKAGERCVVWVERTQRWVPRKMPCISRIQKARDAGLI